ncbi:MAG: helix-turn-helix domain-containing protein [Bacteroidota bacterium]
MPEVPGGSSFEADLRAIREDRGLTPGDIERATRVPADVVRRFEDGALMRDPDFSAVYLRAFVKAYAEALDLSAPRTNAAFDAARAGTYRGELRTELATDPETGADAPPTAGTESASQPAAPSRPPSKPTASKPAASPPTSPKQGAAKREGPSKPNPVSAGKGAAAEPPEREPPPAVEALAREAPKERAAPPPSDLPRRSAPARLTAPERSWGLIIGIAVFSVAALAVVFALIFRQPGPDLEPVAQPVAADTTAADTTVAAAQPVVPPAPQIGDTVRVTVIAADGPLQNFRVQASPDVRRPYWMEQGAEQTFASPTEVIVWGNETASGYRIDSEARLRIAGLTWTPAEGAVQRLTRARAQAVVDSLHQAQYEG